MAKESNNKWVLIQRAKDKACIREVKEIRNCKYYRTCRHEAVCRKIEIIVTSPLGHIKRFCFFEDNKIYLTTKLFKTKEEAEGELFLLSL